MTYLPGLDDYITRPDYASEDRDADLEKAEEYLAKLSAQEIAEEAFHSGLAYGKRGHQVYVTAERKARAFLAEYGSRLMIEAHPHLTFMAGWFYGDGEGCIWWLIWTDEDCLAFVQRDCCKDLLLDHFGESLAEGIAESWNEPPERDPYDP